MADLGDDNKTIFTSDLDPAEKAAVASGEARGKREYMKDHPKCGLGGKTLVSKNWDKNYVKAFGHE